MLDNYDLSGKKIILFCTSGGSGIEESMNNIKKYNSKLNVVAGKKFSASTSLSEVKSWLDTLN